jgi:hypothetical protein
MTATNMHLKGKKELSHKHTAIDLGMKIIAIHKDEGIEKFIFNCL